MISHINHLAMLAAAERAAAWFANDVEASRRHFLFAEWYEAQVRMLTLQCTLRTGPMPSAAV